MHGAAAAHLGGDFISEEEIARLPGISKMLYRSLSAGELHAAYLGRFRRVNGR